MSEKPTAKAKKRPLPKPGRRLNFKEAMAATNKQFAETLAKLAK